MRVLLIIILLCLPVYGGEKKSPVEFTWGNSMYSEQYPNNTNLFYHLTDWSVLQTGVSIDGIDSYAGFFGITFNLPQGKKKRNK